MDWSTEDIADPHLYFVSLVDKIRKIL